MKRTLLVLALLVGAAGVPSSEAWAGPGRGGAGRGGRCPAAHARHRARPGRALARLGLSEEQRALVRILRKETAALRAELAKQVREIRTGASREERRSPEGRKALRERVRAAKRAAAQRVSPQADRLLGSLTDAQRAKIAAAAERRGKDADVVSRRLATAALLAPGAGVLRQRRIQAAMPK